MIREESITNLMPPIAFGPSLATNLVNELVFQWVCSIVDADALRQFEDDLAAAIEDFRTPTDPPALLLAKDLIVRSLDRILDEDEPANDEGAVS